MGRVKLIKRYITILLSTASYEILELCKDGNVKFFKDFRKLRNSSTNNHFSNTTISIRLDELENLGAIESILVRGKLKKIVGYRMTKKGLKLIETLNESEDKFKEILEKE